MREFTHDELHEIIDNNPGLKVKSDEVHALSSPTCFEEAEAGKMQMLGIYAEAIGCGQVESAQNATKEVYGYIKNHFSWDEKELSDSDWEVINGISKSYRERQLCHSPRGNDLICYCDEPNR